MTRVNLKALSKDEVSSFFLEQGIPHYRAGQLLHWMYDKYAADIGSITEFSKELRTRLDQVAFISDLTLSKRLRSSDSTEKFLFGLEDGQSIESVLIPDRDRLTLCVSSQVGCAMGCRFCLTGKLGLTRSLKSYEIVDQVVAVNRLLAPRKITNIVMMGMGEPLSNLENVIAALWRIVDLIGISRRKITLSTAGLAPKIALLAEKAPEVNLAISLNAADDRTRDAIMPVNRKYPLNTLLDACRKFPLGARRRITFEYVMIEGINDSVSDAERLTKLLRGIRCKINLIPLNAHPGSELRRPSDDRIAAFQEVLIRNHLTALIRESKGTDISAACGQLKACA